MKAAAALLVVCLVAGRAVADEEGKLPDAERVSYQTAFPQTGQFRMPTFMDIFATISQDEPIKVGLKWEVDQSKAKMAYATRLSAGHKPIAEKTDDYHIEVFSKLDDPAPADFTKLRFRQKKTYSGTIGYHAPGNEGTFTLYDNKAKDYAKLKLKNLEVENTVVIKGDVTLKGKLHNDAMIETSKSSIFAGTVVGDSALGGRLESPEGKGMAIYSREKGGTIDEKYPRLYIAAGGNIGAGTTNPKGLLHLKTPQESTIALRVETGMTSIGETSIVEIDGSIKGKASAGQRLQVLRNGNVGINSPKPAHKLQVGGAVKIDSGNTVGPSKATLYVANSLTKCDEHSLRVRNDFFVSACGKVGVKVAKPQADFHVQGMTKTSHIEVDKDAKILGTLSVVKFAPLKGAFVADTLKIEKETQLVGKVQMDGDLVVKGNLFVEKQVKMVGGQQGGEESEMSAMLESRIALIEESHRSLEASHRALQDDHSSLLASHDKVRNENERLQERVEQLETQAATRR